jgi:hypothetical protein
MNSMPSFTAESALRKTNRHYQSLVTQTRSNRNSIISQLPGDRKTADWLRDRLGFGRTHCTPGACLEWANDGYDPWNSRYCVNREDICYWLPY